jgi:hypothetical protein
LLKIKEEESEEKENQDKVKDPQEVEEEVEDKDLQDKTKLHKLLNSNPQNPQHESNVMMYIYLIDKIK